MRMTTKQKRQQIANLTTGAHKLLLKGDIENALWTVRMASDVAATLPNNAKSNNLRAVVAAALSHLESANARLVAA